MNRESTLQDRLGSTRAEEVIQTPTPSSPVDIKMIKGEPPDSPEAVKSVAISSWLDFKQNSTYL